MFQKIDALCDNFKNLEEEEIFIYLLTADNDIASLVGKFTETHLPLRCLDRSRLNPFTCSLKSNVFC